MNEIEILRRQATLERSHVAAVTRALESIVALGSRRQGDSHDPTTTSACEACADYLASVAPRVLAEDRAHVAELLPRLDASDAGFQSLLETFAQSVASHESAVRALVRAVEARHAGHRDDAELFAACRAYVCDAPGATASLAPLLARHYGVAEWRRTSQTTADSIATERRLFRRAESAVPGGVAVVVSAPP